MTQYNLLAIPHKGNSNVLLFYDYDRETVISEMQKYYKRHGFTMAEKEGTFTIANLLLQERELTGKELSRVPYCKIFDIYGKRIKDS